MDSEKKEDVKITNEDIIKYWLNLFPEIKDKEELNTIFDNVSSTSIESLLDEIANSSQDFVDEELDINISLSEYLKKNALTFDEYIPFCRFYMPLINTKVEKFIFDISKYKIIENVDLFTEEIVKSLLDKVFEVSYRVIVLEINIARMEGKLYGETSNERFYYFCNNLLQNKEFLIKLYREYANIVKIIDLMAKNYFDNITEIIKNTTDEIDEINRTFNNGSSIGSITKISTDLGDTHCNGKTVSTIYFCNGIKLIYKPRSLELEDGFQNLLYWIEKRKINHLLDFKLVKLHRIKEAGWMEFIEHEECKDEKSVKDFYTRSGHILCLLYILNSVDFHYENVIASGDYPILIDLECIFHGKMKEPEKDSNSGLLKARHIIDSSVQSINFLPSSVTKRIGDKELIFDIGGLSANEEQLSPIKSLYIEDIDLDTIKIVKKDTVIKTQLNNPTIKGVTLDSTEYIGQIKEGFKTLYCWIMNNKVDFFEYLRDTFTGMKSRFILKPTFCYAQLLRISSHPDFMREWYQRKVIIQRIGVKSSKENKAILNSEYNDLMVWDIPFFRVSLDDNYVIDSRGQQYNDMLTKAPMEIVEDKVNMLSEEDLIRQCSYIEMSYLNKENREQDLTNIKLSKQIGINKLKSERWIDTATQIGEHILTNGIYGINDSGNTDRVWIGPSLEGIEENIWNANVLGFDLYNGSSGIALFLGYLGHVLNRSDFKRGAMEAVEPIMRFIQQMDKEHPYLVGAFTGASGYFYTLNKLANLFKDDGIKSFIKDHVDCLETLTKGDKVLDVIGGSAGNIGVILSMLYQEDNCNQRNKLLHIATNSYEHLANARRESELGLSWPTEFTPAYTGFSHGSAGIIAYLYKLYKLSNNADMLSHIKKGLQFQRNLFSQKYGNWFSTEAKDKVSNGWCHGAPGILLSNLILKENGYEDKLLDKEIEIAIGTINLRGIGNNPTYCHGDLGNLAILNYASKVNNDSKLSNQCINTFQQLFDEILAKKWNKGRLRCTRSYSLMIGLSAFGYSMVKNYAPDIVPEFLWLE